MNSNALLIGAILTLGFGMAMGDEQPTEPQADPTIERLERKVEALEAELQKHVTRAEYDEFRAKLGKRIKPIEAKLQEKPQPKAEKPKAKPMTNSINWIADWGEACRIAKQNNQRIWVHVYADWCGPCEQLERNVFTDRDVIRRSQQFVCYKLDWDSSDDWRAWLQKLGMESIPYDVFLRPDRQAYAYGQSYFDAKEMAGFLNQGADIDPGVNE